MGVDERGLVKLLSGETLSETMEWLDEQNREERGLQ